MGMPERLARAVFEAAIREERAGELLDCLFEGGSATIDPVTRKLVLFPASLLADVAREGEE